MCWHSQHSPLTDSSPFTFPFFVPNTTPARKTQIVLYCPVLCDTDSTRFTKCILRQLPLGSCGAFSKKHDQVYTTLRDCSPHAYINLTFHCLILCIKVTPNYLTSKHACCNYVQTFRTGHTQNYVFPKDNQIPIKFSDTPIDWWRCIPCFDTNPDLQWKIFVSFCSKNKPNLGQYVPNKVNTIWKKIPSTPNTRIWTLLSEYLHQEIILHGSDNHLCSFIPTTLQDDLSPLHVKVDSLKKFYPSTRQTQCRIALTSENPETLSRRSELFITITSVNICSLSKYVGELCTWDSDLICVQETGITEKDKKNIEIQANALGWYVLWGGNAPTSTVINQQGNVFERNSKGGLAVLVRKHVAASDLPFQLKDPCLQYSDQGRVQRILISTGVITNLVIYNVYGYSGANSNQRCKTINDKLLNYVSQDMHAFKDLKPCAIVGDLNYSLQLNTDKNPFTTDINPVDVIEQSYTAYGTTAPPTYWKDTFHGNKVEIPSRLDYVIMQQHDVENIVWAQVEHAKYRLSTHVPISFAFSKTTPRGNLLIGLAPPVNVKNLNTPSDQDGELLQDASVLFGATIQTLIENGNVNEAWGKWNELATWWIMQKQIIHKPCVRGSLPKNKVENSICHKGKKQQDHKLKILHKAIRQTKELLWHLKSVPSTIFYRTTTYLKKTTDALTIPCPKNWNDEKELRLLCNQLNHELSNHELRVQRNVITEWKNKLRTNHNKAYKWLKEAAPPMPRILLDRNNQPTGDSAEQLRAAQLAWSPYLCRYNKKAFDPKPFIDEYKEEIAELTKTMTPASLNADDFYNTLQHRKKDAAGGLDSWRTQELQFLPKEIITLLVELLRKAEQLGQWPSPLTKGLTKFLSKGKGVDYLSLRPITLMSIVYSTWSTTRSKELANHLEKVLPDNLYGGRKLRSTIDAEIPGAMKLEVAKIQSEHILGMSDDYAKCFDTIAGSLIVEIWKQIGINPLIIGLFSDLYSNHERKFAINGYASNYLKTNSLVQGCALSLHAVNTLFAILSLRLKRKCPNVETQFYVDDSKTRADLKHFDELLRCVEERTKFNTLAGLIPNNSKCIAWATSKKSRQFAHKLLPVGGKIVSYFPSLGFDVNTSRRVNRITQNQKCAKAIQKTKKIDLLPFDKNTREHFLASVAIPKMTYGTNVCLPAEHFLVKLRNAVLRAMWSHDQKLREPSIVFLTTHKAHRLHPKLATFWNCLVNMRWCLRNNTQTRHILQSNWTNIKCNGNGPISVIRTIFDQLGCTLDADWNVTCSHLCFNFLNDARPYWGHHVRKLLKRYLTAKVKPRKDWDPVAPFFPFVTHIHCIQNGTKPFINQLRSRIQLWVGVDEQLLFGQIRTVCSGSFRTADRLKAAKLVETDLCPHCQETIEDPKHFWQRCEHHPKWRLPNKINIENVKCIPIYEESYSFNNIHDIQKRLKTPSIDDFGPSFYVDCPRNIDVVVHPIASEFDETIMYSAHISWNLHGLISWIVPLSGPDQAYAVLRACQIAIHCTYWPVTIHTPPCRAVEELKQIIHCESNPRKLLDTYPFISEILNDLDHDKTRVMLVTRHSEDIINSTKHDLINARTVVLQENWKLSINFNDILSTYTKRIWSLGWQVKKLNWKHDWIRNRQKQANPLTNDALPNPTNGVLADNDSQLTIKFTCQTPTYWNRKDKKFKWNGTTTFVNHLYDYFSSRLNDPLRTHDVSVLEILFDIFITYSNVGNSSDEMNFRPQVWTTNYVFNVKQIFKHFLPGQEIKLTKSNHLSRFNLPKRTICVPFRFHLDHKTEIYSLFEEFVQIGTSFCNWHIPLAIGPRLWTDLPYFDSLTPTNLMRLHFGLPSCARVARCDKARYDKILHHNESTKDVSSAHQWSVELCVTTLPINKPNNLSQWWSFNAFYKCNRCCTQSPIKELNTRLGSLCLAPNVPLPIP